MNTVNDENIGIVKVDKVSGLYDFQIKKKTGGIGLFFKFWVKTFCFGVFIFRLKIG